MRKQAFLFGYGVQGKVIANGLKNEHFRFHIIESSQENFQYAKDDGYLDVRLFDVTKDENLEDLDVGEEDYLICVMDDEHLNVFLTLSLHTLYPNAAIVAISDSIHTTQKLKMAGAAKVIDLYHISANRIHNILRKPIAIKLLDNFITQEDGISFKEILIPHNSYLDGKIVENVDFQSYGILLVGMIDVELSNKFIFVTSGIDHKLDSGDTIVCLGEKSNLEKFETHIVRSQA